MNAPTISNSSNPNERGLAFQVPWPCKLAGIVWRKSSVAAFTDTYKLYDTDGTTVLQSIAVDSDATPAVDVVHRIVFPAETTLTKNVTYRVSLTTTSTSTYFVWDFDVPSTAATYKPLVHGGVNWYLTTRNGAGWTDSTGKCPWVSLLISALDDGASAGGLQTHPGMAGGMRG